jgi:hypothetical protein
MHENQANKKLLYEKELDEEAIKIAAAKEASYQQALDNEAISSASALCARSHCQKTFLKASPLLPSN